MERDRSDSDVEHAGQADLIAALRQENEALSQQVKRLVKAEGKLYEYQQVLDAQLREFKGLYELNRSLAEPFDLGRIFSHTAAYVVQNLEYERAVFFLRAEVTGEYRVHTLEGYYDPAEKERVAGVVFGREDPTLGAVAAGQEYLICQADTREEELTRLRAKFLMHEYFVYPLASRSAPKVLLVVGNSAERAQFYRRVDQSSDSLLSMGNLAGLISSLIENHIYYGKMKRAVEQERLAEAKYRTIFENAVEGIFRRTRSGRYLEGNPALARMLGYDSVEELVTQVSDIAGQLYLKEERGREFSRLLEEQGTLEGFEAELVRKDGRRIWTSISARVVRDRDGRVRFYEGMIEEITQRKLAEEALKESERQYRELSEALEQRVKETVDELRQKDKLLILQSRQAVMGEMLSNIAHQWRQPLNMLGLLVQDLQMTQKVRGLTEEYVQKNVRRTLEILGQMSRTIDDFRYFFKPESARVEFRVADTIEKTLSMLDGSFQMHGIRTRFEMLGDPVVQGYPSEFIQVLLNIMINARDALTSAQVKEPLISVTLALEDGRAVVTIADNAGGIPKGIIDKIFEPYFTTKGPDQGTGIGLYMCKTIVEKNMQGRLRVRNVADGAEFRIEFG